MDLAPIVASRLIRILAILATSGFALAWLQRRGILERVEAWCRDHRAWVRRIEWTALAAFLLYFATLALFRHYAFLTNTLDLGNVEQAVWNTAHGQPFRLTTDAEFERADASALAATRDLPDTRLAFHVEPILLPLSLVYALLPRTETLLLLQVLAIAVSAWLIGRIAEQQLRSLFARLAFLISVLLAEPMWNALAFDVHPIVFGLPAFLAAYVLFLRGRYGWSVVAGVALLLTREDAAIAALVFGLFLASYRPSRRHGLLLTAISAVWLVVAFSVLRHFSGGYQYLGRYDELRVALQQVSSAVVFLLRPERLLYLLWLLAPLGLLPLFGWRVALVASASVAAVFFTSSLPILLGIFHYHAFSFGVLAAAAVAGAASLAQRGRLQSAQAAALVLLSSVGMLAVGHRLATLPKPDWQRVQSIRAAVRLIPQSASVAATWSLGPWVSRRSDFALLLSPKLATADYVLARECATPVCDNVTKTEYDALLETVTADPRVRLIFQRDRILLYARQPSPRSP